MKNLMYEKAASQKMKHEIRQKEKKKMEKRKERREDSIKSEETDSYNNFTQYL